MLNIRYHFVTIGEWEILHEPKNFEMSIESCMISEFRLCKLHTNRYGCLLPRRPKMFSTITAVSLLAVYSCIVKATQYKPSYLIIETAWSSFKITSGNHPFAIPNCNVMPVAQCFTMLKFARTLHTRGNSKNVTRTGLRGNSCPQRPFL